MNIHLPANHQDIDEGPKLKEYPVDEPCHRCGGSVFRTVYTWKNGVVETVIDCEDCGLKNTYNSEVDL